MAVDYPQRALVHLVGITVPKNYVGVQYSINPTGGVLQLRHLVPSKARAGMCGKAKLGIRFDNVSISMKRKFDWGHGVFLNFIEPDLAILDLLPGMPPFRVDNRNTLTPVKG